MTITDAGHQARSVFDDIERGGIAIVPLDVAYAVLAMQGESVERVFAAKRRSADKPNGMMGDWDIFSEVHDVDQRARDVVRAVTIDLDLPLSVVAPFRIDHPLIASADPVTIGRSTKLGTLDLLLNAGPVHREIARLSGERGRAVFGSSANTSMTGSKFRLEDVDAPVREVATVEIDRGLVKYANDRGISSTIIDLATWQVHRYGVCFDQISDALQRWFGISLPQRAAVAA
jgi:tRNA A37 threonylcarbamoyladenosine synthetase subunit TsaC/SUA5/YrdC